MYINLGELYNREKKDSALVFFNKALLFNKEYIVKYNSNLATYYFIHEKYNVSLKYINKSLDKQHDEKSNELLFYLDNLNTKINIYIALYNKNKSLNNIKLALNTIKLYDEFIDIIKKNNLESDSKLFWQNEVAPIYSKAVYCCKQINNKSLAFYYLEKNKALQLTNHIFEKELKSKLPITIINKELNLKKQLYKLQEHLLNPIFNKDSIENKIFEFSQKAATYTAVIKNKYPNISRTIKSPMISLNKMQQKLNNNEVALNFISDDYNNVFYELIITKNSSQLIKINNSKTFKLNLNKHLISISKPLKTKQNLLNFKSNSYNLYLNFFPSKELRNLITGKHLIISPDGQFQNLPFESLITKPNSLNYLINDTDISYTYSLSFLNLNNNIVRNASNDFLGMAPIKFNLKNYNNLPYSKFEIEKINSIYNGDILANKNATKKNFLELSNDYKIIHLATHADLDSLNRPWIAFKNNKLLLHELYTTKTQADLVVLSACNTSLGKTHTGEGVFSLARGFFYSGTKTVVSSLWNVNDKATTTLMVDFHKQIKKGKSKSTALTLAKRNYIKNHSGSEASPYYWASFILMGDAGNIDFLSDYSVYYWTLLMIFILAIAMFLKSLR